jgi:integrase/recombinase XerD
LADNLYLRGTTWWARFWVGGDEYRRSLRTTIRKEAKERLKLKKDEIERAHYFGHDRMTWKAAAFGYIKEAMPAAVKPSTQKRYIVSLNMMREGLDDRHVDEIGRRDIAQIISRRRLVKATNATIRRDLTAMSRVFAYAISKGACEHNPARDFDRDMLRERRDPISLPTDEEVTAAIAKAPTPLFGRIMSFAVQTGMRQAEILGLEWRGVDLVRRAVSLDKTKTDSPRVVPLAGPVLGEALGTLQGTAKHKGLPLVFGLPDGRQYANFPSNYSGWRREQKVAFRFHDLRHKFAVSYLRHGGNIYDLQQILGHASIKTTEIYLAFLTPEERTTAKSGPGTQTGTAPTVSD